MKCPYCKHIIRRKDEICNKCGKLYPKVRVETLRCKCKECGSYNIEMETQSD